jgi:hypothetical protein
MPPQKTPLADAWEDDWESIADVRLPLLSTCARSHLWQKEDDKPKEPQPVKLSKAQLKAQHAELNRKIWESAYVPLA